MYSVVSPVCSWKEEWALLIRPYCRTLERGRTNSCRFVVACFVLASVRLPISRSLDIFDHPFQIGNSTHTTIPDVCSSTTTYLPLPPGPSASPSQCVMVTDNHGRKIGCALAWSGILCRRRLTGHVRRHTHTCKSPATLSIAAIQAAIKPGQR